MYRAGRVWVVGAVAWLSSGCSITLLDAPHSAPPGESEPWRRECRKVPLAIGSDAGMAGIGALIAFDDELFGAEQAQDRDGFYTAEKALGYGVLGASAASLVYGVYVGIRCGGDPLGGTRSEEPAQAASAATASGFPDQVLEYPFGASPGQVQQVCVRDGGVFPTGESNAFCRSPVPSLARPDARFEFRFGQLSQVTLLYPTTAEQLHGALRTIFAQAKSYYGSPPVGPAPWSTSCDGAASLQCLQNGDKPWRSLWRWAIGEIELVPVLADPTISIELRYTRYDHSGE